MNGTPQGALTREEMFMSGMVQETRKWLAVGKRYRRQAELIGLIRAAIMVALLTQLILSFGPSQ